MVQRREERLSCNTVVYAGHKYALEIIYINAAQQTMQLRFMANRCKPGCMGAGHYSCYSYAFSYG